MTRLALLALAVLLAACANAPAGYVAAPTYGAVSGGTMAAIEAQNAAGTSSAYAATGDAYRAIAAQATVEYHATQDTLRLAQTQAAMNVQSDAATSAAAYAATITQESVNATATARAVESTKVNQAIIATGTQLAYDAQVADAQAQAEIMQARSDTKRAESFNDTISGGAYTLVWIVAALALITGGAVSVFVSWYAWKYFQRKQEIDTEEYQAKSEARTDEARARAAEVWARVLRESIIERGGKEYLLSRRGLVPMIAAPAIEQDQKLEGEWHALAEAYIQSATELGRTGQEEYPFSEPTCVRHDLIQHPDTRRLWREGYRRLIDWLVRAEILAKTGNGGKTDWAGGWSLDRFEREFSHTALPNVPKGAVPVPKILGRAWEVGELESEKVSL